jgi:hypothetical protein
LDLQLPVQSVPITTKIVSYKPALGEVYSKKKLCDKVIHGRRFTPGTPASSTTKTDRPDIAEILLKVGLNTINQIKSTVRMPKREMLPHPEHLKYPRFYWQFAKPSANPPPVM